MDSAEYFYQLNLNRLKNDNNHHTFIHNEVGVINTTLLDLATTYRLDANDLLKLSAGCKSSVDGWKIILNNKLE